MLRLISHKERKKRLAAEWIRLFSLREALENQRKNIGCLCDQMDTKILLLEQTVEKNGRRAKRVVWESQLEDAKIKLRLEENLYQEVGVRLLGAERQAARIHEEMEDLPGWVQEESSGDQA